MTSPPAMTIEVVVPLPVDMTFTYAVPQALAARVAVGMRVLVPFGRRKVTGYVVETGVAAQGETKEIVDLLDPEPLITAGELAFLRWSASYYLHPLGEVLKAALPSGINIESRTRTRVDGEGNAVSEEHLAGGRRVKTVSVYRLSEPLPEPLPRGRGRRVIDHLHASGEAEGPVLRQACGADGTLLKGLVARGFLASEEREVYRDPFREEVFERDLPRQLNSHQEAAFSAIAAAVEERRFAPFLLHGVTGSGKTEVYLQTIAHVLARGRTALVLVPEIALTPQLVTRFRGRFSCGIAVLHSGLAEGERYDEWRRIRRGEAAIVIGARSAIFAPLERLGIIVVDEEHEGSFKQSEGFRYNARDLALVRGKMEKSVVVLGSATPLVTSRHAAEGGKMTLLTLPERVRNLPMPATEIVDMRRRKGETLSPELRFLVGENLASGGQTLLFLNRRGFATWVVCDECGEVLRCPNCAVTLTYHQGRRRHFCHYCDYSLPAPSICGCGSGEMKLLGRGTERLEEEMSLLFPEARIDRLDRDTTRGRGGHARVLKGVEEGRTDILIGTQMLAKGHDFPGVTLVGVVAADTSLNLPDFRSGERTFQLISQVMGRAGRGDQPGRVVIQTLVPDHYAIARAAAHDYAGFYAEELLFRRELAYPPFAFVAVVHLSSTSITAGGEGAEAAAQCLRTLKREMKSRVEILGPAAAPLAKVRGRFRWQLLTKSANRTDLHRLLVRFRREVKLPGVVRVGVDIDPVDML